MSEFMTVDEVAERLRIDAQTLHRWRREQIGPPYIQVKKGATVIYKMADLIEWESAQTTKQ